MFLRCLQEASAGATAWGGGKPGDSHWGKAGGEETAAADRGKAVGIWPRRQGGEVAGAVQGGFVLCVMRDTGSGRRFARTQRRRH